MAANHIEKRADESAAPFVVGRWCRTGPSSEGRASFQSSQAWAVRASSAESALATDADTADASTHRMFSSFSSTDLAARSVHFSYRRSISVCAAPKKWNCWEGACRSSPSIWRVPLQRLTALHRVLLLSGSSHEPSVAPYDRPTSITMILDWPICSLLLLLAPPAYRG